MKNKIPHILIVDDDTNLLATMSDILKLKGFEPVSALTGRMALAQLEKQSFDLALVDLRLEDMSGLEILRAIKTRSPETECILLTGHASQNSAIEAIQLGVFGYFQKPYEIDQVLLSVQRALEKSAAARALQKSERFAHATVDALSSHIAILDETGNILAVNRAWREFAQANSGEKLSLNVYEGANYLSVCENSVGINSEEASAMVAGIRAVMSGNEMEFSLEYPCHSPNQKRWFNAHITRFSGEGPLRIAIAHENITQRKQAEEQVRKLSRAVEQSPASIVITDLQGIIEYVNPTFTQVTGYAFKEAVGQNPRFLQTGYTPHAEYKKLWDTIKSGNIWQGEFLNKKKTGETYWELATIAPVLNEDGEITNFLALKENITERKLADQALRESEERSRLAHDAAELGTWHQNLDTQIFHFDERARQHYDVDESQPSLQLISSLLHPDDAPRLRAEIESVHNPGSDGRLVTEYRVMHRDGSIHWLAVHTLVHFEERDGKRIAVFAAGTSQDITARKQAEIEIKERTEELELINTLNEAVNRGNSLDKIIELFAKELGRISLCKDATIYLLSPDGKNLVMQHLSISPARLKMIEKLIGRPLPKIQIPVKKGSYFDKALQSEQGMVTSDPKIIQQWMGDFVETNYLPMAVRRVIRKLIPQIYNLLEIRSTLIIRLVSDKKVIGLLDVSSAEVMTEKELTRIRKISGQLTAVILREQANQALLESEERYRSIFDGVQDAIFVESKDGRILGVNNRACEMYGYSRDEFLKKTIADLVPKGSKTFPPPNMQPNIPQSPLETLNLRANGDLFPIEINGGLQTINGEEILLVLVRDITERKRTEEALDESEQKYRLLFDEMLSGVAVHEIICDPHGKPIDYRFLAINQAFEKMTGLISSVVVGKTVLEVMPATESTWIERYGRVALTREPDQFENFSSALGKYFEVRAFSPMPGQFATIFNDITERKLAEENIIQRIKELELLYESGLAFGHLLDPKEVAQKIIELLGEKLDWHHTVIRLIHAQDESLELVAFDQPGLEDPTEEHAVKAHLSKFITGFGEGLSDWALQQSSIIRSGDVSHDPHYIESYPGMQSGLYVPLKSGEHKVGVISIESEEPNAFSEADEHLISTLANQAAISFENARLYEEINRYAEELEKRVIERTAEIEFTRKRLDLATKAGGIGVWEINLKENKIFWDRRMHFIHGTKPEEFDDSLNGWWNRIHAEDLEQVQEHFRVSLQTTGVFSDEHRIVCPDGSLRHVSINGLVLSDAEYYPERMIGVEVDITDRKLVEETLRLANVEMERGMRMKNEFLANMSHELRTPLNAILGISESLEEQISGKLNEKQLKYVRIVGESGRHLLDLINDILDLSKIEAGKLELDIQTMSVERLCISSLRMVRELALKKSLGISLKIDDKVKIILGDERRLKQSLVNLLGNAVKFTPQGRRIGLEVVGHSESHQVTFTVWDEGIGIAQEDMQHLFQPFVQLNAGLAREFAGTGLGLALVSQMVRLHGGRVDLKSELESGSRFIITLPWMPAEQNIQPPTPPKAAARSSQPSAKRSGKILIVDDTEVVVQLISEYLRHKGYETVFAYDGVEAVLRARQEQPQIILMDIMMPVMNGLDATRQIRADATLQDVPIIGLTALAMPEDREQCLAAGMNDHLSKPIQMQELAQVVERYLNSDK